MNDEFYDWMYGIMSDKAQSEFYEQPSKHVKKARDILDTYNMTALAPISAWTTGDLVSFSQAIDAELQTRYQEGK